MLIQRMQGARSRSNRMCPWLGVCICCKHRRKSRGTETNKQKMRAGARDDAFLTDLLHETAGNGENISGMCFMRTTLFALVLIYYKIVTNTSAVSSTNLGRYSCIMYYTYDTHLQIRDSHTTHIHVTRHDQLSTTQ